MADALLQITYKKDRCFRCMTQRKHQLSIFLLLCKKLYFLFSR